MNGKKVLVGISGGVDSSVAAFILMEKGYYVEGLHIMNGFPNRGERDAQLAATKLKIPLRKIDLTVEFKREVVDYFISEYMAGRTPNPCIKCNREIKFKYLLKKAREWNFDYIATGHYARIERDISENKLKLPATSCGESPTVKENVFRVRSLTPQQAAGNALAVQFSLLKGVDRNKDQSYFLFFFGQEELAKILFPNGDKTKGEIKRIASQIGLESLAIKESQEICFIPDNNYRNFIRENVKAVYPSPGNIIDREGNILGRHPGIHSFTIGQRRGLNISSTHPYYVLEINKEKNEVVVSRGDDLDLQGLTVKDVCWVSPDYPGREEIEATVQIRYRHKGTLSRITTNRLDKRTYVKFINPEKAVAPGQAAVFYRGEQLLGGGWIE
ncbi:MAG: tRNA 2-thiouridine(34) synthase MnmA [Syntrophales bacterium]|nr:tRNA 2-thiouridine(34) synthase MnmA [Syntrophales bacterium]